MEQLPTRKNDLLERTAIFGENIIEFCMKLEKNNISTIIIKQLVRSGTSVGANYYEANSACSRKDFSNKIFLCKKEAEETKYWLRMLAKCLVNYDDQINEIANETQALVMIFQKIVNTLREPKKENI
jgi:four helix bundle protein